MQVDGVGALRRFPAPTRGSRSAELRGRGRLRRLHASPQRSALALGIDPGLRPSPSGSTRSRDDRSAQKSGLSAVGTAEYTPGYHWVLSAQTSSIRSSVARRSVMAAVHGVVNTPSSSIVTWICSPSPL